MFINTTCDNGTQLVSVGLIGTKLSYQSTLFITDMHVIIEKALELSKNLN